MEKRKKILSVPLIVLLLILIPTTVFADFGPKDRLTVYVKNAPDEEYYLDLLQQKDGNYENIDPNEHNRSMLDLLTSLEDEGWYPALYGGTNAPLFGELTGKGDGENMVHVFSYFGLPQTCRIIIATESGEVKTSSVIERHSLQGSVTFDYATGDISSSPVWVSYVLQYISTLLPTLLIEGIILILLGYSLKENAGLFLSVNIITQIFLTLTAGHATIIRGPTMAFLRFFPHEMAILAFETIIYGRFLKGRQEKPKTLTRSKKITYGILSNLASWIISMLMINMQFEWLMSML